MKVATILPVPLLDTLAGDQSYQMCLFQVIKDNPEAAAYFKKQRELGHFVIMDNGAAEGVNPTAEDLMEVYPLVNPSEIVLPDVVYDKAETIRRSRDAYCLFREHDLDDKYQFMGVPQGNCFTEWLECMKVFLAQPAITTIGVSKFVTPKFQDEMGKNVNVRLECVDAILTEAEKLERSVQIHLLGCWENPAEIGKIAQVYGDKVRGTDSGIAYVYTRAGVLYDTWNARPDNDELDFHNGTLEKGSIYLLQQNIEAWTKHCQG